LIYYDCYLLTATHFNVVRQAYKINHFNWLLYKFNWRLYEQSNAHKEAFIFGKQLSIYLIEDCCSQPIVRWLGSY